jgi:hypothetical protein
VVIEEEGMLENGFIPEESQERLGEDRFTSENGAPEV